MLWFSVLINDSCVHMDTWESVLAQAAGGLAGGVI